MTCNFNYFSNEHKGALLTSAFNNTLEVDIPDNTIEEFATDNTNNVTVENVMKSFRVGSGQNWEQNYKKNAFNNTGNNLTNNLNQVMKNTATNYNQNVSIYNKQVDIANRHQELVSSNARKIEKQFKDLSEISDNIALRTRAIELNEEVENKKLFAKRILMSFFVMLPFLLIPIILITTGTVTPLFGIIFFGLVVLGYGIYLLIVYLRNKTKRFAPVIKEKVDRRVKAVTNFYDRQKKALSKELSEYVYGECDCPEEENGESDEAKTNAYLNSKDLSDKLSTFDSLIPGETSLDQFQSIYNIIGCGKNLTDKDIEFWRSRNTMKDVIEDMKKYYRLSDNCTGTKQENDFCQPGRCDKVTYKLRSNGPLMYYDGSAPPEQIYPEPIGSFDIIYKGVSYTLPEDFGKLVKGVKNPIDKIFFVAWAFKMEKNGVKMDDPRLKSKLNIIEREISDSDPEPYWRNIKLPLVDNFKDTVLVVCQKYNSERKDLGEGIGKFLVDTWNYFFEEQIPPNVYEMWINKLNEAVKNNVKVEKIYDQFMNDILKSNKFRSQYGSIEKFIEVKLRDIFQRIIIEGQYDFSTSDVSTA